MPIQNQLPTPRQLAVSRRGVAQSLKYAEAVELYSSTCLTVKDIASRCNLSCDALEQHLRRHHRELVLCRHHMPTDGKDLSKVKITQSGRPSVNAHEKYKNAVAACDSKTYLEMNVSQIARQFHVDPTGLASFMRRHYPDILPRRERRRRELGLSDNVHRGMSRASAELYKDAVHLYRTTNLTMLEIATRCGVSERGLLQHLCFYHKDILQDKERSRKLARAMSRKPKDALLGNGRKNRPLPSVVMKYAAALSLYKSTNLMMKAIVAQTGVSAQGFRNYLHKWHKPLVLERAGIEADEYAHVNIAKERTRMKTVTAKYASVIDSLKHNPRTVAAAAREFGHNAEVLRQYLHKYEPVLAAQLGMTHDEKGRAMKSKAHTKYAEAIRLYATTSESMKAICTRLDLNAKSVCGFMRRHYPEISKQHHSLLLRKAAPLQPSPEEEGAC